MPSASVSTRTIVPPGTFASAAAVTLASASPVSTVSSERWWPNGAPLGGAVCDGVVVVAVVVVLELPFAALAMP